MSHSIYFITHLDVVIDPTVSGFRFRSSATWPGIRWRRSSTGSRRWSRGGCG